jgi:hypothetical protein
VAEWCDDIHDPQVRALIPLRQAKAPIGIGRKIPRDVRSEERPGAICERRSFLPVEEANLAKPHGRPELSLQHRKWNIGTWRGHQ